MEPRGNAEDTRILQLGPKFYFSFEPLTLVSSCHEAAIAELDGRDRGIDPVEPVSSLRMAGEIEYLETLRELNERLDRGGGPPRIEVDKNVIDDNR